MKRAERTTGFLKKIPGAYTKGRRLINAASTDPESALLNAATRPSRAGGVMLTQIRNICHRRHHARRCMPRKTATAREVDRDLIKAALADNAPAMQPQTNVQRRGVAERPAGGKGRHSRSHFNHHQADLLHLRLQTASTLTIYLLADGVPGAGFWPRPQGSGRATAACRRRRGPCTLSTPQRVISASS